ncbi:MAG: hypothetical protein Q4F30_01110 [Akkermansia sp.]|nr:hypothetical protein [Akkermansia sp.]
MSPIIIVITVICVIGVVVAVSVAFMSGKRSGLEAASNPLEIAKHKLRTNNHPWAQKRGIQIVEDKILKILEDKRIQEAIEKGLKGDGLYDTGNPDIVVAILLNKFAWDLVSTGRFHVHRGLLSPIGEGMEQTVLSTTQYLVDKGKLTEQMADNWRTALYNSISSVG